VWQLRLMPNHLPSSERLSTKQLANEFLNELPGCVVLAPADDAHITGPPELTAAAACERRRFFYAALLQG